MSLVLTALQPSLLFVRQGVRQHINNIVTEGITLHILGRIDEEIERDTLHFQQIYEYENNHSLPFYVWL